jgi:hypothetical protein
MDGTGLFGTDRLYGTRRVYHLAKPVQFDSTNDGRTKGGEKQEGSVMLPSYFI